MYKAFGIVSSSGRNIYVDGMQDYRPIGAFSFLGRYRVIDFPISNMTNSDIDRIQVYINNTPFCCRTRWNRTSLQHQLQERQTSASLLRAQ